MTDERRRPGAEEDPEATTDAAPEGASGAARPDVPEHEGAPDEESIRDPDPEQADPESGAAAG